MCFFFFNPGPVWRVPIPNRYTAKAKLCFCKNNKRTIIMPGAPLGMRAMARGAASADPGDHATNLGATMLVLLRMAQLAYFLRRLGTL
jgi:hypothetical protein